MTTPDKPEEERVGRLLQVGLGLLHAAAGALAVLSGQKKVNGLASERARERCSTLRGSGQGRGTDPPVRAAMRKLTRQSFVSW